MKYCKFFFKYFTFTDYKYIRQEPMIRFFLLLFVMSLFTGINNVIARNLPSYISFHDEEGYFTISESGKATSICFDKNEFPGVKRVLTYFQNDILAVSGSKPTFLEVPEGEELIIVGTLGKSDAIKELIEAGKINTESIEGRWESFLIEVIEKPFPGVERALVIVGSDKRGTIYGIFDLSKNIGVSPWYWWADVPVKKNQSLYVVPGRYTNGEPAVKYRGIFLNDEEPSLGRWAVQNYGGFNSGFYEKLFELILRLKGNYVWPAMWWASFNSDDTLNPALADEMGVVMGTSHHEPMTRAHAEWGPYKGGAWNYETNEETLKKFWTEGIERMGSYESIVTIGMRGDGDKAMSEESNIGLLEKIVKDQRTIIEEVTGKDPAETPQLWALYKEVQEYYNKGMRVPEDVTLLLCDDNWGNHRMLPKPDDPPRSGGYGVYYHFDFVGGPVSYKWLNTSPVPRVWEQMNLAYRYGVDRIWLVNAGDLKPMELPISFFLDFAWNPDNMPAESIPEYHIQWAEQQFGKEHAESIAEILIKYTQYNGRRTPEMIRPDTYSLFHYREAERIVNEYNELAKKAEKIYSSIPEEQKDAYYQLVLFPVLACANLNDLHVTTGLNHLYAEQGRAASNAMADRVRELFAMDTLLRNFYHDSVADGKWNNMMNQTHISYTNWDQPEKDVLPELKSVKPKKDAEMGIAIEGSSNWWPNEKDPPVLPEFDVYKRQKSYIEIFNRGRNPFHYSAEASEPWIILSMADGTIGEQERIWVEVDWNKVPKGTHRVPIAITSPQQETVTVLAEVRNPESPARESVQGHIESNGYISIEANNYTDVIESDKVKWQVIPNLSRTDGSSVTTFPVTASSETPGGKSPRVEYKINLLDSGVVRVMIYVAPTLNFNSSEGLKYAVSVDDEAPQIVNIHEGNTIPDWNYPDWWNNAVTQKIMITSTDHNISEAGEHTLKYWMVDPGVVLQKIVVDAGGLKPSYLGPPESYCGTCKTEK